jgi:hypothetical protein
MRVPPRTLQIDKKDTISSKKYKKEIENFYFNYDVVSDIENRAVIQTVLLDKDVFSLIKTLRERSLSVNDSLNILNNREDLFHELIEKKFIFETKGYVYIFSDVRFIKFNPFYIIEKLVERYKNQIISLNEYLAHLKLLAMPSKNAITNDYEII